MMRTTTYLGITLVFLSLAPAGPNDDDGVKESRVGGSFHVPYRRTNTNHYLVRVRLNGKGPFNFLVDTGAPALFIGTEAAKAIDLAPSKDSFWTPIDKVEIEGGAVLKHVKARIEDPFQLTGMNALGLPGAKIDGILGFTMLAKFRMEFDPTADRLVWTRLDYNPKEPFIPKPDAGKDQMPVEVQAMQALGPAMKLAAIFLGKQPEDKLIPRGSLGVELSEEVQGDVRVSTVWASSPAEKAGLKPGDRLIKLNQKNITSIKAAHEAVAQVKAGDKVPAAIQRGADSMFVDIIAAEGL
jgi:PDZ domain/Aspartyl protease